jgi:spermidine/putrescine-binding protein
MEAGFNQGKIAMMINGPWSWDNARKSKINSAWQRSLPWQARRPPHSWACWAMISKASPNKDLATEFLENQMLQINGLKTINADVPLGTPANKVLFAELKANPNIQATMESAQRAARCRTTRKWAASGRRCNRRWKTSRKAARPPRMAWMRRRSDYDGELSDISLAWLILSTPQP